MKKSSSYKRHRNPPTNDEKAQEKPFFSKGSDKGNSNAFFTANNNLVQPKLTVGQPGDKYEKEADSVADKVVNKSSETPEVQQQEISSIQRSTSMSPAEDEKLGTAEARMEKDKMIQEKSEEEESPIQKMDKEEDAVAQPIEEEEPIQKMDKDEDAIAQPKEEEEPIQKMEEEESIQKKEEKEEILQSKEEDEMAQAKSNVAATPQKSLGAKLKSSKGSGKPINAKTKHEMESSIGADFNGVNIHTDAKSVEMNQELKAQAFTNGKDIYFNSGKYNPESTEGKRLLAHELTHVVQQGGSSKKNIQKQGTDTDPDSYLKGDNHWFENRGQALNAANMKLNMLSLQNGPNYRIEHHTLPVRGLPHYHVYHIDKSKLNYNGHFFYKTKRRRRQYKVDRRTVYNVVMALGLSLALIAVIIAAVLDPEPVTKLGLAGLSMAMIGLILSKLDAKSDNNNEA